MSLAEALPVSLLEDLFKCVEGRRQHEGQQACRLVVIAECKALDPLDPPLIVEDRHLVPLAEAALRVAHAKVRATHAPSRQHHKPIERLNVGRQLVPLQIDLTGAKVVCLAERHL